jgi:cobalt-zinc-cadmium efflux system membrane fusion protein
VKNNRYELTLAQFKSSEMKLGKLELREFNNVVQTNGMIDVPPANRASISPYFGGYVKEIDLLTGQRVKKGQVLFTIENPEFVQMQQDFLEAKGELVYLSADYERQKSLSKDNVTSQKNFLKAQSDYTVTKVRLESLRKKLELMNINPTTLTIDNIRTKINVTSPIDGYVTKMDVTRGAYLNPMENAVNIVNTDHLHLELNIFEKDISSVKIGQKIRFQLQEEGDQQYEAVVHLIDKSIDERKRTIGVHGHFLDESLLSRLNPGMYVEAQIETTSEKQLSLPQEALVEIEGNTFALLLVESTNGYTFVRKRIKTGTVENGFVVVTNASDFPENAQFLVEGAYNLINE